MTEDLSYGGLLASLSARSWEHTARVQAREIADLKAALRAVVEAAEPILADRPRGRAVAPAFGAFAAAVARARRLLDGDPS